MKLNVRSPHVDGSEPARLVTRMSGARTAQFGAGAIGVMLLGGAFLGGAAGHAGLAPNAHQTWLEDGPRGQLVEIDTVSGQAQQRLNVATPGDVLEVKQRAQNLLVQDRTTGTLRTIDLTTLLAEGERAVRPGADTQVILDGPRVAVAQLSTGVVQGIDPISSASIGAPFAVGAPLTSAVADTSGHVWGLSTAGRLVELAWAGTGYTLRDSIQVRGAGAGSGLSAHASGVTVLVTPTGSVEDAADNATGTTNARTAPGLGSPVLVGVSTPPGVVPAASHGTSVVVIATPSGVVQPDLAAAGCAQPLAPVVFQNRVYVPCDGSPEVVVLKTDGSSAGPPITVPSGHSPELTVANGTLVVNVPGATSVVLVNPKGAASSVGTEPPGIPTTSQSDPAPMPSPSSTPPPSSHPKQPTHSPSAAPSKGSDVPSLGVTLSPSRPKNGTISIGVDWSVTNPGQGSKFLVTVAVDGGTSQTLQVPDSKSRSAVVTVSCPGSCAGTASVNLIGSAASASSSWTSVTPTTGGGSGGSGPNGGSGSGSRPGKSGRPGGTVVGPSASAAPSASVPTLPLPGDPVPSMTPAPIATGPATVTPTTARPTPTMTPSPIVSKPTQPAPTQPAPTQPAPATTAPQPPQPAPTTAAPAPTSAAPAPPPTSAAPVGPAAPTPGETVITRAQAAARGASVTLYITEPADWAASGAACTVENDGDDGAAGAFTCDSTSPFTQREVTYSGDSEDYYVRATMPDGTISDSAHVSVYAPEPPCTGGSCCNTQTANSARYVAAQSYSTEGFGVESEEPNQIAPCP